MKKENNNLNTLESQNQNKKKEEQQGYPLYPVSEDIYKNYEEEIDIDPEDITKTKVSNSTNALRRKEIDDVYTFDEEDLDVPGAELDDTQEAIGSEDEENNYYSLGGDDHEDLEEDKS